MKKYILLLSMMLVITGCSNEDNTEAANESEESEEIARLQEENEELKRQQAEQENEQDSNEEQDEAGTETTNEDEDSTSIEDTESENNDRSSLIVDINSPEVQAYLNKNGNYDDEGNFIQDAISIGMTQSEVESLYGKHEFIIPSMSAEAAAVYENIAVLYEESGPAEPDNNIDPDNNKVSRILYYANITEDELFDSMGTPDEQLTNLANTQNYIYNSSSNEEWASIVLSEWDSSEGLTIGTVSVSNENPSSTAEDSKATDSERYFDEYYTEGFPVTLTPEKDKFTYETMQGFIFKTYLNSLQEYFNNENDGVLEITTGDALNQVQNNKASGAFSNYQNYTGQVLSAEQISEREYRVTVERSFSHASTDGEETAQITYTIVDTDGMLKVSDF